MSKPPDLCAFPIPRKGGARPIAEGPEATVLHAADPAPRSPPPPAAPASGPPVTRAVVATTVKLDEGRYLRLIAAGAPAPGRLRRRTIQDMLIEALDDWLARHDT